MTGNKMDRKEADYISETALSLSMQLQETLQRG